MPSGNIQRTLQGFVSTIVSSTESGSSDNGTRVSARTTRRAANNGSWIISDLAQNQQRIQQALNEAADRPQNSNNSASFLGIHPRQSAAADMDFDLSDSATVTPQITSPTSMFESSPTQLHNADTITNFMEAEIEQSLANFRTSGQFDVTDLSQSGVPLQQLHQILRGASNIQNNIGVNPAVTSHRPNNALRNKIVYKLNCAYCCTSVCERAMRAILLADTKIELYSTDIPPKAVVTMNEDRMTAGCNCKIRDTVCSGCGNVLGYHVSQPCDRCLEARNNGHFWMFCSEGIVATERIHFDGSGPLYWASLSPMCDFVPASSYVANGQAGNAGYESFCR